jgi:hypothetical protein
MKKSLQIYFFFSAFILLNISSAIAQRNWKNNPFESKAFIENKGQFYLPEQAGFNSKIVYGNDGHFENHFFTPSGVAIVLESMKKRVKSEEEKAARAERRKQGFYSHRNLKKPELVWICKPIFFIALGLTQIQIHKSWLPKKTDLRTPIAFTMLMEN